jgi:hypothetical protein
MTTVLKTVPVTIDWDTLKRPQVKVAHGDTIEFHSKGGATKILYSPFESRHCFRVPKDGTHPIQVLQDVERGSFLFLAVKDGGPRQDPIQGQIDIDPGKP